MINRDTQLCMSLAGRPGNFGTRFHNYLYEKLGLNFIYKAFTTQDIEAAVKGVRALGIRGCAVSMPFKESCMTFLDAIDPSARVIDSVNTIVNDNGHLTGFNTDFIAVKNLIASHQLDTSARVMIQGSGGMGKAVIAAFRDAGFSDVIIAARNEANGTALAKQYGFQWQAQPEADDIDILVNVTPIGMAGGKESEQLAFNETMVARASVVFDVVALPPETPVIQLAQRLGKKTISGAEVIALQAVEQFVMYTGVRPDDALVAEAAAFARAG
ncbi:shikimate 5-dehydrogenase [Kluyvera ascorbata]|uniref:shikimate 5-dehydrogenase n=1 Tax=Kluyvera ascorbata TaxID=51288 RepID=UPI0004E315DF|nr:shikimate 5-dehydrogenase [Kluyvera ascorbata]EJG2385953.1 shikimate 5-dehydrogenase [Kluyvera ascorbata]KFD00689.1 shikimate 5-dehydrogenase I gamma [Kluyvera ascorbata ATCC 33433]MDU1195247.1 shikimate 5-dehydrogenase [Kluyvera ascorbata]STX00812.1 Shikimate 5-dehydrogenase-like protein HI_0607 [Kluyvera ascorbata]HBL0732420.1 shikimate 5-dehydrogenase [Kluyvera ascorbata]